MVSKELLEYIKSRLLAGESNEIIEKNLSKQGWNKVDIDTAFSISNPPPATSQFKSEKPTDTQNTSSNLNEPRLSKIKDLALIRVLVVVGGVFLFIMLVVYLASRLFIQRQFSKIEIAEVKQNVERANDAINNLTTNLGLKLVDWANWDDTYQFADDGNQAYIDSNLQNSALSDLALNYMFFFNINDQLVTSRAIDLQTEKDISISTKLKSYLASGSILLKHSDEDITTKGILELPEGPLIIVSHPIFHSDGTGPSRGTILFAELLNSQKIKDLSDLTHLNINIYSYHASNLPKDVEKIKAQEKVSQSSVTVLGKNEVAGYKIIQDVFGQPALIIKVVMTRDIYNQGQNSSNYYLLTVLFISLLASGIAIFILNRLLAQNKAMLLKDEFFSIASHELRTPLTAIRGNSIMLKKLYADKVEDQHFTTMVDDIYASTIRLIEIVNDYLDVARLEEGKIKFINEQVNVDTIINEVISELTAVANEKEISLKYQAMPDTTIVNCDRSRIKQIIYNLIGNAIKFTQSGGVTVRTEIKNNNLRILFTDTGPGISLPSQKQLFKKFRQVSDNPQTSNIGSSGLGLYISKMLIEKMGGKIELVSSEIGRGTTFGISLPLREG